MPADELLRRSPQQLRVLPIDEPVPGVCAALRNKDRSMIRDELHLTLARAHPFFRLSASLDFQSQVLFLSPHLRGLGLRAKTRPCDRFGQGYDDEIRGDEDGQSRLLFTDRSLHIKKKPTGQGRRHQRGTGTMAPPAGHRHEHNRRIVRNEGVAGSPEGSEGHTQSGRNAKHDGRQQGGMPFSKVGPPGERALAGLVEHLSVWRDRF